MFAKPLIFDIHRASTADGPGLRTTVFLKGCNLDCYWCHNPEGKSPAAQSAFFEDKCVACGACRRDESVCLTGARRVYGKQYSPIQLFDIIIKDKDFYLASGGGVTFSGGECMLYPDFVAKTAKLCKDNGISVAIDTAGCVPWDSFLKVLPYTDLFLYDIKCLDPELHKKGTGVSNTLILQNLERLIAADKKITVRTPLIPDFNEGDEAERIKKYCADINLPWEGLAFHTFGENKLKALI